MNADNQRDQAIYTLSARLEKLSKLYKECYLSFGRGSVMAYAIDIIEKDGPNKHNYRTKKEILDLFDAPSDNDKLSLMIGNYNQRTEGIMVLITDFSNASYFITVNLS